MRYFFAMVLGAMFTLYVIVPLTKHPHPNQFTEGAPRIPRITQRQTVRALVTAYDAYDEICVDQHAHDHPHLTATGKDAERPGVAADLAVIPAGSVVIIPGLNTYVVDDTGGAMRKASRKEGGAYYQLDVRIPAPYASFPGNPKKAMEQAHVIARSHGAHWMDVEIIPPNASD